jgi:hypothetical protein
MRQKQGLQGRKIAWRRLVTAAFLRWKHGVTVMSKFAHHCNTAFSPLLRRCAGALTPK